MSDSRREFSRTQDVALIETLRLAVPLEIDRMRHWTPQERTRVANAGSVTVGAHGDALQFKGVSAAGRRHTMEAFVALARGLAAGAYQPGGIDFAGQHWCVDQAECNAAERAAKANPMSTSAPSAHPQASGLDPAPRSTNTNSRSRQEQA